MPVTARRDSLPARGSELDQFDGFARPQAPRIARSLSDSDLATAILREQESPIAASLKGRAEQVKPSEKPPVTWSSLTTWEKVGVVVLGIIFSALILIALVVIAAVIFSSLEGGGGFSADGALTGAAIATDPFPGTHSRQQN